MNGRPFRFLNYVAPKANSERALMAGTSPLAWLETWCGYLEGSDLPLAQYFRSTFCTPEASSKPVKGSNEIFPCPPPFPWVVPKPAGLGKSRRRRDRWCKRRACELWVNLMVCALSHEALGVNVAPERGRRGVALSSTQSQMAARLQSFACSVVRLGHSATGCGLRLPATADRLSRLREQLNQFDALPYSCSHRHFQTRDGSFTATQALPVVAERLSLPDRVQDFDPRPYLSPTFRHIYEDPDAFLKPEAERPEPIKIRGTASRRELLKVLERWDHLGRLFVCDSSEVRSEDRCELFAVAKDADKDRQILHRKRRNLQERHIQGASRDLPHGVLLCQLPLEGRYVCACSVDDVKDFYHAYPASEARARSSPVGPVFRPGEVSHLKAFQEALAAGRVTQGGRVACCFKGLGMGDHAAVDIAQESHVNLLRSFGAMKEGETLRYRDPVPHPPSGFVEGIMIDDHLGLQLLPRLQSLKETLAQPARDQEVFAASGKAYSHAGLQAHPKKAVRRGVCAKVWGAEIEGEKGLVGPVRSRLMALGRLSSEVARPGAIDQQTLDGVLGLWGFCAQFRRPIFSFLYEAYRQQGPGTAEEPFRLSTGARNEFAVLACLAPLCLTDLHVLPDKYLYCVDASPSGAGVCRSEVGVSVVREIWRRGDKQGYRMPLLSRLSAALKESGLDEDDVLDEQDSQSEISDSPLRSEFEQGPVEALSFARGYLERVSQDDWRLSIPPALKEGPWDFLELYSGCGQMSASWAKQGFSVLPPVELKRGWDMTSQDLFWGLLGLLRCGKVKFLWWAPPCTTFSSVRHPKLRNLSQPWGFDILDFDCVLGNLHAVQSMLLALVQLDVGHAFGGEQPAFGSMRALRPWELLKARGAFEVLFDWCRYARLYTKTTRVITNFRALQGLQKRCHHTRHHPPLKGHKTTLAGAYSRAFCERVASFCASVWDDFEGQVSGDVEARKFGEDMSGLQSHSKAEPWGAHREHPQRYPPTRVLHPQQDPEKASRLKRSRRKRSSALWAVQLSEGLTWKTCMQYKFTQHAHINIQEAKARRSLFKRLPCNKRVVVCQDSRVNLGALGKGRSPAAALNRVMRSEAPLILGKNLYVSGLHLPTWSIRADSPSRCLPVSPPRIALPPWFWQLRAGLRSGAASLDALQGLPRAYNRWMVFVGALLLQCSGSPGAATAFRRRQDPGALAERPSHREDAPDPDEFDCQPGGVALASATWDDVGDLGSRALRRFVRLARRIYGCYVSTTPQPSSCSRDLKCPGPTVWMAEILACRAVESGENLGAVRTSTTSPAGTQGGERCTCRYCSALAVAADGGFAGAWLFWIAEALRAYWTTSARSGIARRPLRRRRAVHPRASSQNQISGCNLPTCSSRVSGCGHVDHLGGRDDPDVEADLEWLLGLV